MSSVSKGAESNVFHLLGQTITRYRWSIVIASLAAVMLCASGLPKIIFNDEVRFFFGEKNEDRIALEALEKIYNRSIGFDIIVTEGEDKILDANTLKVVRDITEELWQVSYVTRVNSIANFQRITTHDDELDINNLLPNEGEIYQETLDDIYDALKNDTQIGLNLISKDLSATKISIGFDFRGQTNKAQTTAFAQIKDVVAKHRRLNPHLTITPAAGLWLLDTLNELGTQEGMTLFPLVFIIFLLSIVLWFRSILASFYTMLIILMSTATAIGLSGIIGIEWNLFVISAPVVILTVAIAGTMHMLKQYNIAMAVTENSNLALLTMLERNFKPVFVTSLTTAIGFLTLNLSDSPPIPCPRKYICHWHYVGLFSITIFSTGFDSDKTHSA